VKVEILYFSGCPHYPPTVQLVHEIVMRIGAKAQIVETEITDAAEAQRVGFLGSPTVRVNGRDVEPGAGQRSGCGWACRTYQFGSSRTGVPPQEWIEASMREAAGE
jgi:hypothetical protein